MADHMLAHLAGIGVVAGGAAGFFVGGLVHPTRYTPHRNRRFVLGGAFVGIMAAMAHLTFVDPACLPHNRGLGR